MSLFESNTVEKIDINLQRASRKREKMQRVKCGMEIARLRWLRAQPVQRRQRGWRHQGNTVELWDQGHPAMKSPRGAGGHVPMCILLGQGSCKAEMEDSKPRCWNAQKVANPQAG